MLFSGCNGLYEYMHTFYFLDVVDFDTIMQTQLQIKFKIISHTEYDIDWTGSFELVLYFAKEVIGGCIKMMEESGERKILIAMDGSRYAEYAFECKLSRFYTQIRYYFTIWAKSCKNVSCHMRTTRVQISLCIRAVWSAPLFFAA